MFKVVFGVFTSRGQVRFCPAGGAPNLLSRRDYADLVGLLGIVP